MQSHVSQGQVEADDILREMATIIIKTNKQRIRDNSVWPDVQLWPGVPGEFEWGWLPRRRKLSYSAEVWQRRRELAGRKVAR